MNFKYTVSSDEELEKAEARVCSPVRYFDDDVRDVCARCGRDVYLRPHGPMKLKKICAECFVETVEWSQVVLGTDRLSDQEIRHGR